MKAIRSMTLNKLIKTRAEIESAIYYMMQAEQNLQLKRAMSGIEGMLSTSTSRKGQPSGGHPLKGRKLPPRFRNPKKPQGDLGRPGPQAAMVSGRVEAQEQQTG